MPVMPQWLKKKCSMYGCREDAASSRAQFCKACFNKNAAAAGSCRGTPERIQKKCSTQGCVNGVQGSRWARLCAACFYKKHLKQTSYGGRRSALLSNKSAVARISRSRRQLQRKQDLARWDGARRFTRRRNLLKVMSADCFKKILPASVRESLRGIAWLHGLRGNADGNQEKAKSKCSSSGCRKQARSSRSKFCPACFEKNSIVAGRRGALRKNWVRLLLDFQVHARWAASNLDVLRSRSGTGLKEKLRQHCSPDEGRVYQWLHLHASDLEPASLLSQQLATVDAFVTQSKAVGL